MKTVVRILFVLLAAATFASCASTGRVEVLEARLIAAEEQVTLANQRLAEFTKNAAAVADEYAKLRTVYDQYGKDIESFSAAYDAFTKQTGGTIEDFETKINGLLGSVSQLEQQLEVMKTKDESIEASLARGDADLKRQLTEQNTLLNERVENVKKSIEGFQKDVRVRMDLLNDGMKTLGRAITGVFRTHQEKFAAAAKQYEEALANLEPSFPAATLGDLNTEGLLKSHNPEDAGGK